MAFSKAGNRTKMLVSIGPFSWQTLRFYEQKQLVASANVANAVGSHILPAQICRCRLATAERLSQDVAYLLHRQHLFLLWDNRCDHTRITQRVID